MSTGHSRRMRQLHKDLSAVVSSDTEQELLEPATQVVLASVRAAYYSLPDNHPLRAGLEIELITMEQLSGASDPIRIVDLLPIVGQLVASLPNSSVASPALYRIPRRPR